ncbi:MAG: PIN/TRAM domain-containing protein [Opitutales bacterium]
MSKTILVIRIFFFLLCIGGAVLLHYVAAEDLLRDSSQAPGEKGRLAYYIVFAALLASLTILVDILIKGFSLRGLTALTFGLFTGTMIAHFISFSPLFEEGDEQVIFLSRLSLFIICTYLATVITLRGKDEFNLVIPYMRFVPQKVELPTVVVDTSALIDGRIVGIAQSGFMPSEIVVTRFVIDEIQRIADSDDPVRQEKGRKGLQVLSELRKMPHVQVVIHESEVERRSQIEAKLIFIARSLNARLLTLDYNLAKLGEFQNVGWLNVNALARALRSDVSVGERFDIELIKPGREAGQAVGFLNDGSMVVVNDAEDFIGQTVWVEVVSVLPSAGGKLVFGRLVAQLAQDEAEGEPAPRLTTRGRRVDS